MTILANRNYMTCSAGRRGDVEQGKGESVAPGVTKQRLVNADARWGDAGTTENLSQGQQRPSSLRSPLPKTPRARRPAGDALPEAAADSRSSSRHGQSLVPYFMHSRRQPPLLQGLSSKMS